MALFYLTGAFGTAPIAAYESGAMRELPSLAMAEATPATATLQP